MKYSPKPAKKPAITPMDTPSPSTPSKTPSKPIAPSKKQLAGKRSEKAKPGVVKKGKVTF